MSLEALASRYISSAVQVLAALERVNEPSAVNAKSVDAVLECVSDYLEDAKYYKAQRRFETSLTSVAYSEGLLDALRLLGLVKFEWPTKPKSEH